MFDILNNIGDMIHNLFDSVTTFFENVGNSLIDLWNYTKLLPEYVSAITRLLNAFIPPIVWPIIGAILALCIIKIATGRDG